MPGTTAIEAQGLLSRVWRAWKEAQAQFVKLRPDLIESVERSPCCRFSVWPWQLVAQRATKVVCKSLDMGKRSRFLAKKDIGVT